MSFPYNQVFFVILIIIVLIPPCHNFDLGNHLINFFIDIQSDVRRANFLPEPMKASIKPIKDIVFVLLGLGKTFVYCLLPVLAIIHILFSLKPGYQLTLKNLIIIQNLFTSLKPDRNELIQKLFARKNIFIDHAAHIFIIKNFFTSLKPHPNELIRKWFARWNVSYLVTFLKISLRGFIILIIPFIAIRYFLLFLLVAFLIIIQRLFRQFKLLDFFLSFVVVIQITVIVYRIFLHYKYVYSYENPYEPDIHGTFVSNEQKSSYLWTLFFSFVTSIRDFCGIVRMGAEGFGSNNLRRIIFTTKSGSPYVPQVPF